MSSNRRYADKIDRQMAAKIAQVEMSPKYRSLPPELTEIEKDRPVQAPEPIAVTAWIDITAGTIPIEAVVREWNQKAARIEWTTSDGSQHSAWVYLGAIRRRGT
ncbi:hypothetical protein ACFJGV_15285 [Cnuibacter sp. UC19_7]|uniref:hypothetical protein n=1 Tax=Cnuibacter sp. UC19_7 TaxID=3350166 RepID=UPI003671AC2E